MKNLTLVLVTWGLLQPQQALGSPYQLQYGGRITQANGQPVTGTTSMYVSFYNLATGGSLIASKIFPSVPLSDGVFSLTISLTPAEFENVFSTPEAWIEITDVSSGKIYPRQRFLAVPYAFKVPVDSTTIGYSSDGQLMVKGIAGVGFA